MPRNFYNDKKYKERQSLTMKENWKKGLFDSIRKREKRICKGCNKIFEVIPSSPKIYCSHSCAAKDANLGRIQFEETRIKIGKASMGRKSPYKGIFKTPRINVECGNPKCKKVFLAEKYRDRKYCSNKCHMTITGGKPTSPKAFKRKGRNKKRY
ncbi:MAG: hypothetical protein AAB529_01545 [Patescibacteria group bacterium]